MEIWRVARRLRHAYRHADRRSHRAHARRVLRSGIVAENRAVRTLWQSADFSGLFQSTHRSREPVLLAGLDSLYDPKRGPAKAIVFFQCSADLNPNFYPAWIELGNLHAQRAERDDAVHAFENALQHAPQVPTFRKILADQISILRTAPDITTIHPIRDPFTE